MNPAIYFAMFLPIFVILITRRREEKEIAQMILKRRKTEDNKEMIELARGLLGKECVVYTFNGNQYTGIVKEVSDGALLLEKNGNREIINLDYVVRLREYPVGKNGKKNTVILD